MKSLDFSKLPENLLDNVGLSKAVLWTARIFLDTSHSGSALEEGYYWANQYVHYGQKKEGDKNTYEVYFFDTQTYLDLSVYTSTSAIEEANDTGEGLGGKWTNQFLAKGMLPEAGKKL